MHHYNLFHSPRSKDLSWLFPFHGTSSLPHFGVHTAQPVDLRACWGGELQSGATSAPHLAHAEPCSPFKVGRDREVSRGILISLGIVVWMM